MSNVVTYHIEVHFEDGAYWATVKDLPGCYASGDTEEELNEGLIEAIGLYLSSPGMRVTVTRADDEDGESKVVEQRFLVDA